jgi:hypothetical protein
VLPCQQLELAAQRCEAAGLDLDQQVAADEVDDETADEPFDAIAGALIPVLELSVQRALVERPDRRDLTFLRCGDLGHGAHDDAPSAPQRGCLRLVSGPDKAGPTNYREENDHRPRCRARSRVRPDTGAEPALVVADEPNGDPQQLVRLVAWS